MHGVKKRVLSEAEKAVLAQKAEAYSAIVGVIFERRKNGDLSQETLKLTEKMLKNNPDFYTLWNFRKEILISLHSESLGLSVAIPQQKISADVGSVVRDEELSLSAEGIARNSKSYGAWFHRMWILQRFEVDYVSELALCQSLLKQDQRNFHCWDYRRFVAQVAGASPEQEFRFSTEKIKENFSNYSAFHHRSNNIKLLEQPCQDLIENELKIVENAVFTEPDDQSAWWYHQFLVRWIVDSIAGIDGAVWAGAILQNQLELMRSLLELEPGSKWTLCCLVDLLQALCRLPSQSIENREVWKDEIGEFLKRLMDVDPMHVNRYRYLASQQLQEC